MKHPGGRFNRKNKPPKPWLEFPLYAHAAGVWAKRINGRIHYFGPWGDPHGALDSYLKQRDYLFAGKALPPAEGVTLDELVNRFLAAKEGKLALGEISRRHYLDYQRDGKRLLDVLGRHRPVEALTPSDFASLRAAMTAGRNATTVANIIIRQRSIFRWGRTTRLLAAEPAFGGEFASPSAKARRKALRANGGRFLDAEAVRTLLDASARHPNLRAMILLGVNAGLGNTDCAELRWQHLKLEADPPEMCYPRPKTETDRRVVLWPETIDALRTVKARQAKTGRADAVLDGRVFITSHGQPYLRFNAGGTLVDSIGTQFANLLNACSLHRKGLGFYALRHTFRTVADETKDFPAVDLIMGHVPDGQAAPFSVAMADRYREHISVQRLADVANHVRNWLFGEGD